MKFQTRAVLHGETDHRTSRHHPHSRDHRRGRSPSDTARYERRGFGGCLSFGLSLGRDVASLTHRRMTHVEVHEPPSPAATHRVAPHPHVTLSHKRLRARNDRRGRLRVDVAVLLLVRSQQWGTQSRMADAMGITAATLTHHLNALENRGLVHRWRKAENRRVQHVALTADGEALFAQLREVALHHDHHLRSNLTDKETALLAELLEKLQAGIDQPQPSAETDPTSTPGS